MATQGNAPDDLDAVRTIVEALKDFDVPEQRRIIRWAEEKLGLSSGGGASGLSSPSRPSLLSAFMAEPGGQSTQSRVSDIKSFVQQKQPTSDNQFAAVVAYYYAFEAPSEQRKSEIGASDLRDAARQAARTRLRKPIATLHNAVRHGYLDKGKERGMFRLNAVGENLVAMALPAGNAELPQKRRAIKRGSGRSKPRTAKNK